MSIANVIQFKCQYCGDDAEGRSDQKFCSPICRSRYNNQRTSANRVLAETVNVRTIAYAENVQLLKQLVQDNLLGPHTLDALLSLGYRPESPYDNRISHEEYQETFYGNVRLKKYFGMDRYVLSIERQEKKKLRRASYATKG
jgi:hypothetical protein